MVKIQLPLNHKDISRGPQKTFMNIAHLVLARSQMENQRSCHAVRIRGHVASDFLEGVKLKGIFSKGDGKLKGVKLTIHGVRKVNHAVHVGKDGTIDLQALRIKYNLLRQMNRDPKKICFRVVKGSQYRQDNPNLG
jgi:hypothetical protein